MEWRGIWKLVKRILFVFSLLKSQDQKCKSQFHEYWYKILISDHQYIIRVENNECSILYLHQITLINLLSRQWGEVQLLSCKGSTKWWEWNSVTMKAIRTRADVPWQLRQTSRCPESGFQVHRRAGREIRSGRSFCLLRRVGVGERKEGRRIVCSFTSLNCTMYIYYGVR